MTSIPLRIAMLAHSTNARGGVVHALELAEALTRLGHTVAVHAPDPDGNGFFRQTRVPTVSVKAARTTGDVATMVETRIAEYVSHFENSAHRGFDIFHAQDGISGNALVTLKQRGLVSHFARTVHHVDDFSDPRLQALEQRSIASADRIFVVSRMWQRQLAATSASPITVVGNGVDALRFAPKRSDLDTALRTRLGLREGPVLLTVGGIEQRKNTIHILEAFRQLHAVRPTAQLLIAGGASVLDHQAYQAEFSTRLDAAGLPRSAVIRAGVIADTDMPSLYRLADTLVFASVREGFGLAVLEAMASGIPVIASHIAPFTEYLGDNDVVWCDPLNVGSIANAMATILAKPLRTRLSLNGLVVAHRHDWLQTARAHIPVYDGLRELHHA
ncbi:MSMEG_0565 family glycosyltransferase [Bradyrhizobium prioriisuperbiae]|uniref:MSMEG_0565 family glycosyltransferase n=1 Tax=Bradyrhizobium prioriisuperbiae TaxID=2854389 RepID=UPI0028E5FB76|nr:MSMEG_0565 family glycosyltransferase [Bradyrhizobium prioritasuperba]